MENQQTETPRDGASDSSVIQLLLEQRRKFVAEINRIDRMLAREGVAVQGLSSQLELAAMTHSGRPRNAINKVDALLHVLKSATRPLSQRELVEGIQNLGFVFASRNPTNTLNPLLYGDKKLAAVKKLSEGFILAEREEEFTRQTSVNG